MARTDRQRQIHDQKRALVDRYIADGLVRETGDDDSNVFYVPNQLVVADRVAAAVEPHLERYGGRRAWGAVRLSPRGPREDRPSAGAATTQPPPVYDLDPAHGVDIVDLATTLADQHDGGVALNHLVTGLQRHLGWPDGDPEPASRRLPTLPSPAPHDGTGVSVAIVDTGWPSRMPPHLDWFRSGCDHAAAPGEVDAWNRPVHHVDELDDDRDGYLDVEAGHGLFVAGIIRRIAPSARLVFLKALNSDGVGTEVGVARAIHWAVARDVDVINLSLGFYTLRDGTPAGVAAAVAAARKQGIAVVAAAGNDAVDDRTYPAALPDVVGVGALDRDHAGRADFSNHGSWIDVYAPGQEVQSTFVRGREDPALTRDHDSDEFTGNTAVWSGTSFACAQVTGHLAAALGGVAPSAGPTSTGGRAEALIDAIAVAGDGTRHLVPAAAF
jgi:hypothetical protein